MNPLVSVVMPIRNEAAHIERALDAIDAQTYPSDRIEILVVDGGSTDGTLDVVRRRMETDPRIRLLGGPGVNTPHAMQLGIGSARGELIAKVDGHGWVNDRFIEVAASVLDEDVRIGCVGGHIVPVAGSLVERAISIARFSRLGVGGGVYTIGAKAVEVSTVQCGVYRRTPLIESGGFDPALPYGEDEEANHRLRQNGWRILHMPEMRFSYRVRPSVAALFRQYVRYGRARIHVIRLHRDFARPKHLAPLGLVVGLVGSAVIGAASRSWTLPLLAWAAYAGLLAAGGTVLSARHRFPRPDVVALALGALHIGYGLGSVLGIVDVMVGARGSRSGSQAPQPNIGRTDPPAER